MPSVLVLASINADLVVEVPHRPAAGETVLGGDLVVHSGGKGGNQAAAAARAGADVRVVGRVGDDGYGERLRSALELAGVDVSRVRVDAGSASGTALITLTPDGDNSIVVSSGANALVGPGDVQDLPLGPGDVAVAQLEVPLAAVVALAVRCTESGARLVLNAAPALPNLPAELLSVCDPLVVNGLEAAALAGTGPVDDVGGAVEAADRLLARGCRGVVVTLGGLGAVVTDDTGRRLVEPPVVGPVVDTTGAGDCLVGTLAARLADGCTLVAATAQAVRAASVAVTRAGAQTSFPTHDDVRDVPLPPAVPLDGTLPGPGTSE